MAIDLAEAGVGLPSLMQVGRHGPDYAGPLHP